MITAEIENTPIDGEFQFPFSNYPCDIRDSMRYYVRKMLCFGIQVVGGGLYSRLFLKVNVPVYQESNVSPENGMIPLSLSAQRSLKQTLREKYILSLRGVIKKSDSHIKSHIKYIFFCLIIGVPTGYMLIQKGFDYGLSTLFAISSAITINSCYGIIGNIFNKLTCQNKLEKTLHLNRIIDFINIVKNEAIAENNFNGKRITKKQRENVEFDRLAVDFANGNPDVDEYDEPLKEFLGENQQSPVSENKIDVLKSTWTIEFREIIVDIDSKSRKMHVVKNGYYQNLFFCFEYKSQADRFKTEMEKLHTINIDEMANDDKMAEYYYNKFYTRVNVMEWGYFHEKVKSE